MKKLHKFLHLSLVDWAIRIFTIICLFTTLALSDEPLGLVKFLTSVAFMASGFFLLQLREVLDSKYHVPNIVDTSKADKILDAILKDIKNKDSTNT